MNESDCLNEREASRKGTAFSSTYGIASSWISGDALKRNFRDCDLIWRITSCTISPNVVAFLRRVPLGLERLETRTSRDAVGRRILEYGGDLMG